MGFITDKTTNYVIRSNFSYLEKHRQELLISLKHLYKLSSSLSNRLRHHKIKHSNNLHKDILDLANSIINEDTEFNGTFLGFYEYLTEEHNIRERMYPPKYYLSNMLDAKKARLIPPHSLKVQSYLFSLGVNSKLLKKNPALIANCVQIINATKLFLTKYYDYKDKLNKQQ